MRTMKAAVFIRPGTIALEEKPIPIVGAGEALIKITAATICGTDVHMLSGEYPVEAGRTIGHERRFRRCGTLCPGGKERMRRLMSVVASGRVTLEPMEPMVTHRFKLDQIEQACELFANQRDGVLKVAITP